MPGAVTAFSRQSLESMNAVKADEIGNLVPNMEFQVTPSGSGNGANIFIRGIGQNDFVATTDPGVGLYVDGVYIGRMMGSLLDLADVERVEVLRGPQGTLFGKNTIGGAVQVITQKPDDNFSGRADLTVGRFSRVDGSFSTNVPLTSDLALRVSGLFRSNDGFATRILDGQHAGDDHDVGGRAHLLWTPNEVLAVDLSADVTRRRANPASHSVLPGTTAPLFVPNNPRENNANSIQPFKDELDVYGYAGTIDWDAGPVHVKSISSYRDTEQFVSVDYDGSLQVINENLVDQDAWQFSQEFQFTGAIFDDRIDWLFGLYYLHEDISWTNITINGPNPIDPSFLSNVRGPLDPNIGSLDIVDQETDSYAVFAHGVIHITDRLDLTIGARYTDETKDAVVANPRVFAGERAISLSFDDFTPKVSLDYQMMDDVLLYGIWSKGFRAGGINGRLVPVTVNTDTYDPESLEQFEIGIKSELFDRRVRLNLAGFYGFYDDYQVTTSIVDPVTGSFFFPIDNVADLDVYGAELEALFVPSDSTRMSFAVGYLDEKVVKLAGSAIPFIFNKDSELPLSSTWQVSGTFQHRIPVSFGDLFDGEIVFDMDASYKSKYFQFTFDDPLPVMGDNVIVNAQARLKHASGRWELAVWGKNLTDEEIFNFRQNLGGIHMGIFRPPLEWGATFRVAFD